MGLSLTLGSLLFFFGLFFTCSGSFHENCYNYKTQFQRVFTVPGDVVMLNSTLVAPDVFNFISVPYNITWYDANTTRELRNNTGRTLVRGHALWFLNVTMEDMGEYVTILRTPTGCYRQVTKMLVELPAADECGRPQKAHQTLTNEVTDSVVCPLKEYIRALDGYNIASSITWYNGCHVIENGAGRYSYWKKDKLEINGVVPSDSGDYTCTLSFSLGGVDGSVSETINAWVYENYSSAPQIHEPAGEVIKAPSGSNFTKKCLAFVPCVGPPHVAIYWMAGHVLIQSREEPSDRVYTSEVRWQQETPVKGLWLEKTLMFSQLRDEDFNTNYTCLVLSTGGRQGYFTLLPEDPSALVPIGALMVALTLLFITAVVFYYVFKVDIVLWFRRAFPIVYGNTDLDGKLYDAYVAYSQPGTAGFRQEVETFAVHTLTQVLEKSYNYKLFIAGRDCVPGHAVAESVDENIRASRRLLLLYDASTFRGGSGEPLEDDAVKTDCRQQLECVLAMHRALMEGSLKVVLVELEEITAAQLALLPQSVRHLRKKQGAVCLWKSMRTRHRWRTRSGTQDEEKLRRESETLSSLSPSSRFWKEMRYHMPVRGKRAVSPEKTALMNL